MMKPKFSKPFDLAAARAGAPFCGADGEAVRVLIWDRKHPTHPIIAIEERGEQEAVSFRTDGTNEALESMGVVVKLVMLPLGLIDGKPVFVGDEMRDRWGNTVHAYDGMGFDPEHWFWPAPAKVYPLTALSIGGLLNAALNADSRTMVIRPEQAAAIANAALRHAIDAGQVITAEKAGEEARGLAKVLADRRAERDMAIARAVHATCASICAESATATTANFIHSPDLTAIIATIE